MRPLCIELVGRIAARDFGLKAGAAPVIELSRYVLEPLRKDENFILYRGRSKYDASQILVLSPRELRSFWG